MFLNSITITTIGMSFVLSTILGFILIPCLRKLEARQNVRKEGPKSHYKKTGTPTMGGLIFITTLIIIGLFKLPINEKTAILMFSTLGFGLIGFLDDFLIILKKDNAGLSPKQKLIGQFAIAFILVFSRYSKNLGGVYLPWGNGKILNLGWFYLPFIAFVLVGTVNSVNLTDGLDGLASGVTFLVMIFLGIISTWFKNYETYMFSIILAGACLGFLFHNRYPAKVFMGDTGSLALGGAVSGITLLLDLPLIIPIIGGIYFIEALSVIIQISTYKLTGKKVFRMSPLHHHFEFLGWSEWKIDILFWTITLILGFLGLSSVSWIR